MTPTPSARLWPAIAAILWLATAAVIAAPTGPLFLVDDRREPSVSVSWPTTRGGVVTLQGDRRYLAAEDRTPLGKNLEAYVALGGTRLEVGASDPTGAIIKVGFYKASSNGWLFDDIAPGGAVTITVTGVKFMRPADPRPATLVHHAKFDDPTSVLGCIATAAAATRDNLIDHFNTADPNDTLLGKITPRNGRLGVLKVTTTPERVPTASGTPTGTAVFRVETDGSITAIVTIPYALFKHPDDPWLRSNPGDFVEPFHFHIEFEVVPSDRPSDR